MEATEVQVNRQSQVKVGDAVIYVDTFRNEHAALLTNVFDNGEPEKYPNPAVNLLFVDSDPAKHDGYGRQIGRSSSVSHISHNSARANCWKRVGE